MTRGGDYLKLKSTLDLSTRKERERIAKFVLGAANRMSNVVSAAFNDQSSGWSSSSASRVADAAFKVAFARHNPAFFPIAASLRPDFSDVPVRDPASISTC